MAYCHCCLCSPILYKTQANKTQTNRDTTRKGGKAFTAQAGLPANSKGLLEAKVTKKAPILRTDKKRLAIKKGDPQLTSHPIDALEVGKDKGGLVGDYEQHFDLNVPLQSLTISLE